MSGRSAAWLARLLREQEVGGSNPLAPTNISSRPKREELITFGDASEFLKNMPMVKKHLGTKNLLVREDSVLVLIDIQDKLMPVIANREKVIENIVRLLKFSHIIGLPIVLTEQEKLGSTLPEIKKEIPNLPPITKSAFSCFSSDEFTKQICQIGRKTLIIAGVETHICIAQTALSAIPYFKVYVVSDAVSSRTLDNWHIGIERMRQSGVTITSTEMLIFELLGKAGTDEFRAALKLVK